MSVEIFKGNIFDCPAQIIFHVCNIQVVMGTGIAKEIKNKYPRAWNSDQMTGRDDVKKLSEFSLAMRGPDQKQTVLNLYAMRYYGRESRKLNYEYFYTGLTKIKHWITKMGIENEGLAFAYGSGCQNAGGDWQIVEAMLKSVFENSNIKLYICKLEK